MSNVKVIPPATERKKVSSEEELKLQSLLAETEQILRGREQQFLNEKAPFEVKRDLIKAALAGRNREVVRLLGMHLTGANRTEFRFKEKPMTTATQPVVDASQLFAEMTIRHGNLKQQLRQSRQLWATLPEGESKQQAAHANTSISSQMILLRDLGRFVLGIDPEDDGNPFGDGNDY